MNELLRWFLAFAVSMSIMYVIYGIVWTSLRKKAPAFFARNLTLCYQAMTAGLAAVPAATAAREARLLTATMIFLGFNLLGWLFAVCSYALARLRNESEGGACRRLV